jgi:ketosteroid isomerase-like protein
MPTAFLKAVPAVLLLGIVAVPLSEVANARSVGKTAPPGTEEVRQFFSNYFKAVEAGDPDGILALIDTDFVIKWPIGAPISDRQRLRAALTSLQQRVRQAIKWEILETHVQGNWVWVRSTETPTHFPKTGGEPRTHNGSRLTILRKVGGKWLMHRDYSSPNELPPPPASAAPK